MYMHRACPCLVIVNLTSNALSARIQNESFIANLRNSYNSAVHTTPISRNQPWDDIYHHRHASSWAQIKPHLPVLPPFLIKGHIMVRLLGHLSFSIVFMS